MTQPRGSGVAILDENGLAIFWNDVWETLLGGVLSGEAAQISCLEMWDFFTHGSTAAANQIRVAMKEASDTGRQSQTQIRFHTQGGPPRHFCVYFTSLPRQFGHLLTWHIDLTEHSGLVEGMVRKDHDLVRLLDADTDLQFEIDMIKGQFLSLTGSGLSSFGYRPEDASLLRLEQVVSPKDLDRVIDMMILKREDPNLVTQYETEVFSKDGEAVTIAVTSLMSRPWLRDGPNVVHGVARIM